MALASIASWGNQGAGNHRWAAGWLAGLVLGAAAGINNALIYHVKEALTLDPIAECGHYDFAPAADRHGAVFLPKLDGV